MECFGGEGPDLAGSIAETGVVFAGAGGALAGFGFKFATGGGLAGSESL
jgi:hypothetical protein